MLERETGNKLKSLRTDNGREFISEDVKHLLTSEGIVHQRSLAYTPQQNGKVERENRTVVEAARTMLQAKGLEKKFWSEAVNTAVFVLNRTGKSTVEGKTPLRVVVSKEI